MGLEKQHNYGCSLEMAGRAGYRTAKAVTNESSASKTFNQRRVPLIKRQHPQRPRQQRLRKLTKRGTTNTSEKNNTLWRDYYY